MPTTNEGDATDTPRTESTPFLGGSASASGAPNAAPSNNPQKLHAFLEAETDGCGIYEVFIICMILLNVAAFISGSLFVPAYNNAPWLDRLTGICGNTCDALLFGNFTDNGLQWLNIGSTNLLEMIMVLIFTVEYMCRFATADLEDECYSGWTLFVLTSKKEVG
jgi:hypothetical protein